MRDIKGGGCVRRVYGYKLKTSDSGLRIRVESFGLRVQSLPGPSDIVLLW